jgi:TonB-linked SusC/RagA family outer membrane protein
MKLSILLVLLGMFQARADIHAQGSITLTMQQAEISKVLNKIERKGDFRFLYNYDLPALKKKVDVNLQNSGLKDALNQLFSNTDLTFRILENNLVVVIVANSGKQDIRITGKVTGANGEPLPGVSVLVKGTTRGANTDNNGMYTLTVPDDAVLSLTYIGYETKEVKVNNEPIVNIQLTPSNRQLEQVVVIGYGSQSKKNITSAISTVDTKDISSRPIINPVEAITGKAPGVQVSVPSGTPGGDLSVKIRGVGSPNGGEPLYVVDGILANDIKGLDPNTIESISILKDASAAGIYGAAGSTNGVVMITTKQGTKGKSKIEATVYTGMQQISKKIPVLNNNQWSNLETEIYGAAPSLPSYYSLTNTNNNWQDMIYHSAMQTSANVGMSGGSEKGTYYFNVGYLNQDGIMRGSNFDRYSVKLSIDQNATSWLKVGVNVNYNRTTSRTVPQNMSAENGGAVISALVTPEYIPVKMPEASPHPNVYGYSNLYSGDNPMSDIYNNTNKTIQNHLLGNTYAEVKLPFDLKVRSQLNAILDNNRYDWFLDPYNNLYGITLTGAGQQNADEVVRWAWDNTLTYDRRFGGHSVNVVVGTSALEERISTSYEYGTGFASDAVQTLNGASASLALNTGSYSWSTNSYFGRLMYSFKDKYLLTGTLRLDGSSRVGINNKWGTFPAVSGAWRVSKEAFMQDVSWVQDLKIRAGWGATGNLPPYTMLYPSYTTLNAGAGYAYSSGTVSPGVSPGSQTGNPALKWESAHQTNIGFDASFFNSRVTVAADYYYKKVFNMIFTKEESLVFNGDLSGVNLPGFDINRGIEYNIDAAIVKGKDFGWDLTWNMSFNNNKLTGMDTSTSFQTGGVNVGGSKASIYTGIIKSGYSLGTFYGYVAKGVDPATGNMVYGNNLTSLGNALPKYTFGFTNNFRYKNFSLSLLIDGVQGNKIYDETRMEIENLTGYKNESAAVLGRWEKAGDVTSIPRALGNGTTNATAAALLQSQIASNYVENGSFIRLRNATLGYQFNPSLLKGLGIAGIRIYASAQNVFTITKYKGYYPELNGFGTGTNNQAVNAGSSASLMALGVDNGTYPVPRTYIVGLNVSL